MRGKKAKQIRKMLFKQGIGIDGDPYDIDQKTGIIHASKGRKLYKQIKRVAT